MKHFLHAQEVKNLKAAHRIEKDRRRADRIKTILALNKGLTYEQIAKLLLIDKTTIKRYEKDFKTSEINGLLEDHYHGSTRYLSKSQEEELAGYLKAHLHQTAKDVVAYTRENIRSITQLRGSPIFCTGSILSIRKPGSSPGK